MDDSTTQESISHTHRTGNSYPLPYVADFHRELFGEFESDFESWCARNRA